MKAKAKIPYLLTNRVILSAARNLRSLAFARDNRLIRFRVNSSTVDGKCPTVSSLSAAPPASSTLYCHKQNTFCLLLPFRHGFSLAVFLRINFCVMGEAVAQKVRVA